MIIKLAGRALCLDLGERFLITVIRILDEFFVYPASPTVAPPYHSPNEPTGNRSSRHDYPPEMPGIGPPLSRSERTAESVSLLLAISDSRYPKDAEPGAAARDGWQRQKSRCQPLSCLAVCERHSDVTGRVAGAKAHQHAALLVGARSFKRGANVTGFRDVFSGNLQNHVALFKPAFGSRALRFDLRDNDAFLACAVCLAPGASVSPRCGTSIPWVDPLPSASVSALAC